MTTEDGKKIEIIEDDEPSEVIIDKNQGKKACRIKAQKIQ